MAAATTAQYLVSEVIDYRKCKPKNHREIVLCAVTEVSAPQEIRLKSLNQMTNTTCNKPYVKQF